MSLRPAAAVLLAASALTLLAAPSVAPQPAAAQSTNLAGLVIDTGEEVKRICVRFEEPSIDGIELIRRSGVEHELARFSGQGTGVCSLCGVGCPSSDCFCDQNRFWNYAVGDEGSWQRSPVGAERRTVEHGSVDGWAWGGQGATPPTARFETICEAELRAASESPSPSPSPTSRPTPTTPPTASPSPSPSPAAGPTPGTPAPPATTAPPPATTAPPATPGEGPDASPPASAPTATGPSPTGPSPTGPTPTAPTPSATATQQRPSDGRASPGAIAADAAEEAGGGGAGPLVGFAVLLALLGAGLVALRRRG